ESGVPEALPRVLPSGGWGGFALLGLVFVMSSFLDTIAAALIGATVAKIVFPKVHVGFLAAIVAASNAGGAGSVVGDTTTTMMWIDGVSPLDVTHAFVAALPALIVLGLIAAPQQHAFSPMRSADEAHGAIDWGRIGVVAVLLGAALAANIGVNAAAPDLADRFPVLGAALWAALIATSALRRPDWSALPSAAKGAVFLLSLVLAASMMPVERLPAASWITALGLGVVSAVFDNIPLTALALRQGGYDWGVLAYTVGYGGSMVWFGSSAGVAVTNVFPQGRSVGRWLKDGWHVAVAYFVGFAVLMLLAGWHPHAPHRPTPAGSPAAVEH
ncbi:MAG: citrate transporter, partial [Vicinamibacterales bacterium]